MRPETLDHVALWVVDRDRIADFATRHLGMHDIERTDKFTLIGSDARRGKLTLFAEEGPRERGALKHIALRVNDLEDVALFSRDPDETARAYRAFGFEPGGDRRVEVGGAHVEFHEGDPGDPERPLLNHLAVLVESAGEHLDEAQRLGMEVADVVDAPNTYAIFLRGPEGVKIEYVEQEADVRAQIADFTIAGA